MRSRHMWVSSWCVTHGAESHRSEMFKLLDLLVMADSPRELERICAEARERRPDSKFSECVQAAYAVVYADLKEENIRTVDHIARNGLLALDYVGSESDAARRILARARVSMHNHLA